MHPAEATTMKLCILGGGGFVGRHLISVLASQGLELTVPTRRRDRVKSMLVLPGVNLVEADIHDPAHLRRLFSGMDAVINLVGILHGSEAAFRKAHVELPSKVVTACRDGQVPRLLHMSALGADPGSRSIYQRTKAEGEHLVMAATDLAVTAFRPSVIFGPGDSFLTLFADLLRYAPVLPLASGHARFQPVYVLDVAHAFAASLDDPATSGQAYALCGPRVYSLAQLLAKVAAVQSGEPIILPLGDALSYWMARLMELKPGRKLMTRDNYYAMQVDNVCPNDFPARFGPATHLDAVIGYLRERGPRSDYERFRRSAQR
jgi:NADH dehydrogenase